MKSLYLPNVKPSDRKKVVLYIEDDPSNRDVTQARLSKKYEVHLAVDDIEACKMLVRMQKELDIILVDIELKGSTLDGLQLVKLLRGKLDRKTVPGYAMQVPVLERQVILLVTAFAERFSREEIQATGADKLIAKPVDFVELEMAMAALHLQKSRERPVPP